MREYVTTLNLFLNARFEERTSFPTRKDISLKSGIWTQLGSHARVPLIWLVPEITLLTAKEVADRKRLGGSRVLSSYLSLRFAPESSQLKGIKDAKNSKRAFRFAFVVA